MGETFNFHTPPTNDKEEIEEKRERERKNQDSASSTSYLGTM